MILRWSWLIDAGILPFAAIAATVMRFIRQFGLKRLPLTRRLLRVIGVLPVRQHYFEPLVYAEDLRQPLSQERNIGGLDLNTMGQLALLSEFDYAKELIQIPRTPNGELTFYYHNGAFESGDAEYLYSLIRHFRPRRILEIGSGFSTLMARQAIEKNKLDDPAYKCAHVCIEPFEQPWLEQCGVRVVRERVEVCNEELFIALEAGDILFIDSSHVIRPQGDVLYEYLEILGKLKPGVLIHAHDIFTPRDYLESWVLEEQRLWNEQYLLEAFLAYNTSFEVIGAVNYLWHGHRQTIGAKCPILAEELSREPGSFWFRKTSL